MTTMLEKAARAAGEVVATMTEDVRHVLSERALHDVARAVLMAVREPDHATIMAGVAKDAPGMAAGCLPHWTAMIDSILAEKA